MTQQEEKQSRRFAFTRRAVERLPAHDPASPSRETEYADTECVGLHLRVGKSGRRFYQHRYRHLGRKKCLTLGEHSSAFGPVEARALVAQQRAQLCGEQDPAEVRAQGRNDMTFAEFAEKLYLPHVREHLRTAKDVAWKVTKLLNPTLGHLRLKAISTRDVAALHAKEKTRVSPTSGNRLLATLRRMLNLAVRWGLLEKNPAVGQEMFREPPPRERYLAAGDELPRFL